MRKAWFCYEMSATGPVCAIHYDSLPNEKNVLNPKILQKHELGEDYWFFANAIDADHNITSDEVCASFSELSNQFPYTGDHFDLDDKIKLEAAE